MDSPQNSFPKPGTVLWAIDTDLETEVFRSGASSKPNVEYLRWSDLGVYDRQGRIGEEDTDRFEVKKGQGISLFLERMIPEGLVVMDADQFRAADKKLRRKVHWWSIEQNKPIPAGLELVYDGQPPGHCTLTVTRSMTVKAFLALVSEIAFTKSPVGLYGPAGGA